MQQFNYFALLMLAGSFISSCTGSSGSKSSKDSQYAAQNLIDTQKIKSDMNSILNNMANGKPDTSALKKAGADVLSTTASVLSDSGISKLYADSTDPSVNEAKKILIKMRNASGLTPGALDSIQKAAGRLQENVPGQH